MSLQTRHSAYIDVREDRILLTFLTSFAYFCSYMTRINYKAVMAAIMAEEACGKEAVSVPLTGLFIVYGLGQLVSGWLGDRINPKYLMCGGLALAAAMNILLPFCSASIPLMTVVWCVNGFGQAMMWPPIVKTLTDFLSPEDYLHASVKVSWGSVAATILLYLGCPGMLSLTGWKPVFIVCAAIGLAGAVFVYAVLTGLEKKYPEAGKLPAVSAQHGKDGSAAETAVPLPKMPRRIYGFFAILLLGIILQGMLRDGVDSWMPSYISDTFDLGTSVSILTGVILPVFTIVSYTVATWIYEKWLKNEMTAASVFYILSGVCSGLLLLLRVLFPGADGFGIVTVLTILLFALIVGSMHGINLIFTCFVPRRFRKYGNISWVSGLTNFATYVGSAVSTYGFAVITQKLSWNWTIVVWVLISAAGVAVCYAGLIPWRRFLRRECAENTKNTQ